MLQKKTIKYLQQTGTKVLLLKTNINRGSYSRHSAVHRPRVVARLEVKLVDGSEDGDVGEVGGRPRERRVEVVGGPGNGLEGQRGEGRLARHLGVQGAVPILGMREKDDEGDEKEADND